ncbi:MAG TPA: tRNA lysidine(34) synthetase TilS [Flavobacterium sp.]|jgi:tRNA(Ile)-lysidine synthase
MILKLQQHLEEHFTFLKTKRIFIAVSGGIDSMVLLHLFQQLDFEIAVLHCNFNLRATESNEDEFFIQQYCLENKIPFISVTFDTVKYAEDNKMSIQVAARALRYQWFYEQLEQKKFDFILTAHHLDDALETFIINLSRGTGIEGLSGIPMINDKVIRPLLNFDRNEIKAYAIENKIQWREDSSNSSDKYLRNKIRHQIVPVLKEVNPNFMNSFQNTLQHLQQSVSMISDASILVYQQVVEEHPDSKNINIEKLQKLPNHKAYLYEWLSPFGFTAWTDIYNLISAQSGKQIFSDQYSLLKDRNHMILTPREDHNTTEYLIHKGQEYINSPVKLSVCKVTDISITRNTAIFVDANQLVYPLVLRKWKEGDIFQPLGMNKKSKKVSKLFKDEKVSVIAKEKTWILTSNGMIVWVVGIRQDERFRINTATKNILKIEITE